MRKLSCRRGSRRETVSPTWISRPAFASCPFTVTRPASHVSLASVRRWITRLHFKKRSRRIGSTWGKFQSLAADLSVLSAAPVSTYPSATLMKPVVRNLLRATVLRDYCDFANPNAGRPIKVLDVGIVIFARLLHGNRHAWINFTLQDL